MTRRLSILCWLGLAAVVAGVILCHPGADPQEGPAIAPGSRIGSTLLRIASAGFTSSVNAVRPFLPDSLDVEPETISQTVYASGTWTAPDSIAAGDTLPVEVSAVEVIDGSRWVRVTIGGKPADLDVSAWWSADPPQIVRRWTAHVEAAPVSDRVQIGVGVGYRVCEVWGIGVSPAVTVGVNGEWVAGELRLTRRVWSGVSIGAGGGYRLGEDTGLHLSGGVSVEL